MNRRLHHSTTLSHALVAAALTVALGTATVAFPQPAEPGAQTETEAAGAQNRRERRRAQDSVARETPAAEQTAATPASIPADASATDTVEAKLVCRNIKITGTKISRRMCGTPEQWAAQSRRTTDDAQEAMRQVRDRSSVVVSQPENPLAIGGGN